MYVFPNPVTYYIEKYIFEIAQVAETKYINNVCVTFLALCQVAICATDADRSEKKDQLLKPYVYCMHG